MNARDPEFAAASEQALAPQFPTGWGKSHTHAKTLADGGPNPCRARGLPYCGVTSAEIVATVGNPPSVPKERGQWFIPSTCREHDARDHAVQRERGSFWWLSVDIDGGNLDLGGVQAALDAVIPGCRHLIYSTRSAAATDRKWLALVPLKAPLPGADYHDTATAFYDLLEDASAGVLIPDRALARPAQLVYLPNRGTFYERAIAQLGRERLDLAPDHPIVQRRDDTRRKRVEAEAEAQRRREERQVRRRAQAAEGEVSPVEHFNQSHTIEALLARYGYVQARGSNDWRSPLQQSSSYATRDYGEWWISLSASDAAQASA